ncbi:ribosome-recycling factor [Madurella fahalii]|uniref:Ribosome-recycling factor n=1 Tax=Madurella fahalii TaxID=1157608 RepID=A0ABQ0FZD8_9PEZI
MKCLRAATLLRSNAAAHRTLPRASHHSSTPPGYQSAPSCNASSPNHVVRRVPMSRPFSHTAACHRKPEKLKPFDAPPTPIKETAPEGSPYNFADIRGALDDLEKRFNEELKQVRAGGRGFAESIGAIPVQPDRKSKQAFPLRELATVAPLGGRRWSILAFEEASVKPIMSAVQLSREYNQQPQRSQDNPLELIMTVEPVRVDALTRRAKDVCQTWRTKVRDEVRRRAEQHKKLRQQKLISDDDVFTLKGKLQELQDARMKEILIKEKAVVQAIKDRAGQ